MPHYYFDTTDGEHDTDIRGVDLASTEDAVKEAVRYAGAMIGDQPAMLQQDPEFIVTARAEGGNIVAEVRVELIRPA